MKARALGLRLLAVGVILAAIGFWWFHRDQFQPAAIQAMLAHNQWAPVIFILAHIVISLIFVPRTILAFAAGLIFGLWWGLVLTILGSMAGALAGFMLARGLRGTPIGSDGKRWVEWATRLGARMESGGWRGVALVRLMPIMPHTPVNYAFGLTRIGLVPYAIGSFVGLLPGTILFVDLGATGEQLLSGSWNWIAPLALGLAALAASYLLPKIWLKRTTG